MKKLLTLIVSLTLFATTSVAQNLPGFATKVFAGYNEKGIDFGKVTDSDGEYIVGAEVAWESFKLTTTTHNSFSFKTKDASFDRLDVKTGYTLFSTLADVEVGNTLFILNRPGLYKNIQWQPYVSVGKSFLNVTGTYDVQSRLINFEGTAKGPQFKILGANIVTGLFAGYTDVNDALPKSVKEIKFNNTYYGGSVDAKLGWVSVGAVALYDGHAKDTTIGWRTSVVYKF